MTTELASFETSARRARARRWAKLSSLALLAAGARMSWTAEKAGLQHDEQVSVLTAACEHQRWFDEMPELRDRWVEAERLIDFVDRPERWCFGEVQRTLVRYDIHPPLYYWLLHAFYRVAGVSPAGGPVANALIAFFTAILLGLLFERLASRETAIFAVLLWAVASGPVYVSYQARQYELFTFFAVAVWLVDTWPARTPLRTTLSTLGIVLGGLTHYHFALIPASLFVARAIRREWSGAVTLGASGLLALGLLFAIHPGASESLVTASNRTEGDPIEPFRRLELAGRNLLGFFFQHRVLDRVLPAVGGPVTNATVWPVGALSASVAALAIAWIGPRRSDVSPDAARLRLAVAVYAALVVGPYLLGWTARHTMRDHRYLGPFNPWIAIAVIAALRRCRFPHRAAPMAVVAGAGLLTAVTIALAARANRSLDAVRRADRIVIDSTRRGYFAASLLAVDSGDLVRWTDVADLAEGELRWLDDIASPKRLAYAAGGPETPLRKRVMHRIERHFEGYRMQRVGLRYYVLVEDAPP